MLRSLLNSGVVLGAVLAAGVYAVLRVILGLDDFIIVMNGAYIGAGCAYGIAFFDLMRDAVIGRGPYDRVRQMALSMFMIWFAVSALVIASIYTRVASNIIPPPQEWSAIGRFLAIVGGVAQISAPDVGYPLLYGRDRKLLLFAVIVGILVAVALIFLQGPATPPVTTG